MQNPESAGGHLSANYQGPILCLFSPTKEEDLFVCRKPLFDLKR